MTLEATAPPPKPALGVRRRASSAPATRTRSDDEYLMAAFELDATAFLKYFQAEHPQVHGRYEQLCQANGNLEEFRASPLVFILANKPMCCVHVAKRFIDARLGMVGGASDVAREAVALGIEGLDGWWHLLHQKM